jgi:hypothetical protein
VFRHSLLEKIGNKAAKQDPVEGAWRIAQANPLHVLALCNCCVGLALGILFPCRLPGCADDLRPGTVSGHA